MVGKLRDGNGESVLDLLEDLGVGLAGNKGDTKTLSTESTSSTNSVQVRISISRSIVVDDDVDSFDIDTSTEDVGCDQDSLLEVLEHLVSVDSGMKGNDYQCQSKVTSAI